MRRFFVPGRRAAAVAAVAVAAEVDVAAGRGGSLPPAPCSPAPVSPREGVPRTGPRGPGSPRSGDTFGAGTSVTPASASHAR